MWAQNKEPVRQKPPEWFVVSRKEIAWHVVINTLGHRALINLL